ncbi:unnamed protein product [Ceratitis capitata]|uniref:(Mediterranean fruit fly) hypothetical protein n=1 Tax=Ceratitis capitata TaxID=7213 RepID=A0A811VHJ0_CERCA|nr:unnamed protein product [Ceratitis capitata]
MIRKTLRFTTQSLQRVAEPNTRHSNHITASPYYSVTTRPTLSVSFLPTIVVIYRSLHAPDLAATAVLSVMSSRSSSSSGSSGNSNHLKTITREFSIHSQISRRRALL